MHTHRIDAFLITDNLRLEIVHESNPYFAGEPISLIVRIRHLGSQEELTSLKEGIRELHQRQEGGNSDDLQEQDGLGPENGTTWSMKSLLNAFRGDDSKEAGGLMGLSQSERESNERTQELISKQLQFHKPVDLMSGYLQVSGVFQFDPEVVDESKMEDTGLKMVGIDSLTDYTADDKIPDSAQAEKSTNNTADNSLARYFNSKHTASTIGLASALNETAALNGEGNSVFALGHMSTAVEYRHFPIFLIPQTLLFSEIQLEPGKMKAYRFKSLCLPKDLSPTYNISKTLSITYNLQFGVSRLFHGEIKQYTVRVPINIAPFVNSSGCQYTSRLDHSPFIMQPANVKEVRQKPIAVKRASTTSIGNLSRRSSSFMGAQEKNDEAKNVIQNFVELVKSNDDSFGDIEDLVDSQIEKQFDGDRHSEETSNLGISESQENLTPYMARKFDLVSNNISTLTSLYANTTEGGSSDNPGPGLVPQLVNLQKTYQINWNSQPITKLHLSKSFYTNSDDIDLVLELEANTPPLHKVSAVTVSLESFELINREYAADPKSISRPHGNQVYEAHAICFDNCERIPFKILIPKTPMYQIPSQFRNDIFQFKWMLIIKFVLIPRATETTLEPFYEDPKGILLHAKETIEGEEFSCHISLPILPSAHSFDGW